MFGTVIEKQEEKEIELFFFTIMKFTEAENEKN
jgi:hypothetical protein